MEVALLREGLRDVSRGVESIPALLVLTGGPALRSAGIDVPDVPFLPEDRLYRIVAAERGDGAHSHYNALLRSVGRATRAVYHVPVTAPLLREFIATLDADCRVYLTGGASAILLGWRASTAAIDLQLAEQSERVLGLIAALKERLGIGVETPPRNVGDTSPSIRPPSAQPWRPSSPASRMRGGCLHSSSSPPHT